MIKFIIFYKFKFFEQMIIYYSIIAHTSKRVFDNLIIRRWEI